MRNSQSLVLQLSFKLTSQVKGGRDEPLRELFELKNVTWWPFGELLKALCVTLAALGGQEPLSSH